MSEATQMSDGQDWTEPIKLTAAEWEQLNEALEGEQNDNETVSLLTEGEQK